MPPLMGGAFIYQGGAPQRPIRSPPLDAVKRVTIWFRWLQSGKNQTPCHGTGALFLWPMLAPRCV